MLDRVRRLLNGRLYEEAKIRYERCLNCEELLVCQKDEDKFVLQLARGHCEKWDTSPAEQFAKSPKKKVVLHSFGLPCGGAERWMVQLAIGLDKARFETCLAIEQASLADTHLLNTARRGTTLVFGRKECQAAMNAADILLCWSAFPSSKAKKKIFCSHGCDKWTDKLIRDYPNVDDWIFTAVSEAAAKPWWQYDPTILWNGSDPLRLLPKVGRINARKELGVAPEEVLVGFISRLIPEKNPHLVVAAAKAIPNGRALFVCDRSVKPKDKEPGCIYLPRTEAIGDILAALDIFMLPSSSEAFSMAIIEAWLAGVPVVATPVGAIPELEKQFGQLTFRNVEDVNASNVGSVTWRANRLAKEQFTAKAMVKRWEEFLA